VARPVRIRRKELKRPDEFLTLTNRFLDWARENQRTLAALVVALVVVVAGTAGFFAIRHARVRDANADLAHALAAYRDTKSPDAAAQLAEVARRWSNTSAGNLAKLLAAESELHHDNVDTAIAALQELLTVSWRPYLKQEVLFTYGIALEQKGQLPDAITQFAEAATLEGPYTAQALLAEARCAETQGDTAKARALYERVQKEFPDIPQKDLVEGKLAKLP
jgi:predicted negative regulator of RcsB-dependent stress response